MYILLIMGEKTDYEIWNIKFIVLHIYLDIYVFFFGGGGGRKGKILGIW